MSIGFNDEKVLLAKCLSLLIFEQDLQMQDRSVDMVRTVLETVVAPESGLSLGGGKEVVMSLKKTILDLCTNTEEIELDELLQRVRINTDMDERYYDSIEKHLKEERTDSVKKRLVINIRRFLTDYFKEQKIKEIVRNTNTTLSFRRETVKDLNQYIQDQIALLETLAISSKAKDPAVLGSVDFNQKEQILEVTSTISDQDQKRRIYKTGCVGFDRMTQGGFRVGSSMHFALQHQYKSGWHRDSFWGVILHNKPYSAGSGKKPLALYLSFEDKTDEAVEHMYKFLRYSKTRQAFDIRTVDKEEMADFIIKEAQATGWNVVFKHIDPTQWTYRSVCNLINEYEADGYCVELCWLDYMMLLPRTGCTVGAQGEDMRDLLRRLRNFYLFKQVVGSSPHQLGPKAKELIRGGVPEHLFPKEVANKGYAAGSTQLDQELDLEYYIHTAKHKGRKFLVFMRGKHRISSIIENEDWFYFMRLFPLKGMPIAYDTDEDINLYDKLPNLGGSSAGEEELF